MRDESKAKRNLVEEFVALVERAFRDRERVLMFVKGNVVDHEP